MITTFRQVMIRNLLIAASFMMAIAAQASVIIRIDISDISNGNLAFYGTGEVAQNDDSVSTMFDGLSFIDFFTNQSYNNRYPVSTPSNLGSVLGSSSLVSPAGIAFDKVSLEYHSDSSASPVNNDINIWGGNSGTFGVSMGFSRTVAAFTG